MAEEGGFFEVMKDALSAIIESDSSSGDGSRVRADGYAGGG